MFPVSKRTKKIRNISPSQEKVQRWRQGKAAGGGRPCPRLTLLFQWHLTAALAAFISSRNEKINTIEDHSSISLDRSTGVFIKAILMLLDTQLWTG